MAFIDIDENRWPIVIITLSGKETREDITSFFNRVEDFRSRNEEFCFVLDLREMNRLTSEVRDSLLSWLKNNDLNELAGAAIVVSSPVMRVYLSLMIWASRSMDRQKPRFRHKTVFSLNEAYEWSRDRLQMQRPPGPRRISGRS